MTDTEDDYCVDCGNWLDSRWRACPTCGARLAPADRLDRLERVAAWTAVIAGSALTLGAFLPWATTAIAASGSTTRWGMDGGRGIGALVLGLGAITLGVLALTGRRFAGNRSTLVLIGLLAFGFVFIQRSLITQHISDLRFHVSTLRNTTAAQAKAQQPVNSYGVGLWMIAIAGVAAIVAGAILPKQITPRGLAAPNRLNPVAVGEHS